ncbi:MAG: hypothetical protein HC818_07285 [Synechococcaceae cyanobacterium RM1_1_27]|nr:hypothetical protein [Synechococcaceae cyanobacterium RM1_1_27]
MTYRIPQDPQQPSSSQPSQTHRQPFYRDYGVENPLLDADMGQQKEGEPGQPYQPFFSDRDPQVSRPQPPFDRPIDDRPIDDRPIDRPSQRPRPNRSHFSWGEELKQRATAATQSVFGLGSQLAETVQQDPELSQVGLVGVTLLILGILLLWQWRLGVAVLVGSAALFLTYSWALPGGRPAVAALARAS